MSGAGDSGAAGTGGAGGIEGNIASGGVAAVDAGAVIGGAAAIAEGGSTFDAGSSAAAAGGGSPEGIDDASMVPTLISFRLVVVGSSTSAGEGASRSSRGWVSLLGAALDDRVDGDVQTQNLSRGGYTTNELLPGSGSDGGIDDAIELAPDLIVVALAGSNDLSSGASEQTFLERLAAMQRAGRDAGIPVFFVSTAPKDLDQDSRQELERWADAIAEEFSTCWVPHGSSEHAPCVIEIFGALASDSLGIDSQYGSGDGIHLDDDGHAVIYELAERVIGGYVCSLMKCSW